MKQNIALVLSGGGARGIAHIGAIEQLLQQGFEITSVAGTSMGAAVGAVYALGKIDDYKKWFCTLDKLKVFSLIDFSFRSQGLIKGDKLFDAMKAFIADTHIEELAIPFAAVAADIVNKKEIVFTTGSVYDAVRASIAIPTIFTPVKTTDGLLVDGGVVNNLPLNHVKRTPGDILVAVNVNAPIPVDAPLISKDIARANQSAYLKKVGDFYSQLQKINPLKSKDNFGYFDVINKTLGFISYHTTQLTLEKYSPDILINISHESCATYDFYKAEEMIETGKRAAQKAITSYNNQVD